MDTRSANRLLEEAGAGSTLPQGDCDVAGGDVRQSRGVLVGVLEVEAGLPEVWRVPLAQLDDLLDLVLRVGLDDFGRRPLLEDPPPLLAVVAVHLGQTDPRLLAAQLRVVVGGPRNVRVAPLLALL